MQRKVEMDKNKILKTIRAIETLLNEIKLELEIDDIYPISSSKQIPNKRNKRREGPVKWIEELADAGFLDSSKSAVDVSKEFRKRVLSADLPTIRKELARSVKKGLLTREGEGTAKSPWKYKKNDKKNG